MTQQRLENPKFQAFDDNGDPLSGGKLYVFTAGTSTAKTVYSNYGMTVPHSVPVVLNDRGEALIYFSGKIKIDLYAANDVQISGYPIDYVEGSSEDYGAESFDIVANEAALGTGTTDGQCKVTADTGTVYRWEVTGSAWIAVAWQSVVASVGALGTGDFDGQLRIDAGAGNRYTWDEDNAKWRIMSGNVYTSNPSASTYTIEAGTVVYNTTDELPYVYRNNGWRNITAYNVTGSTHVAGIDLSFGPSDLEHDITLSPGTIRDSTGAKEIILASSLRKLLDTTTWVAGTGAGGFQGTLQASAKYYFHLIMKSDGTVDAGLDTSATAANLLSTSGYSYYAKLGAILLDASANLLDVVEYKRRCSVHMRHGTYTGNGADDRGINIGIDLTACLRKWLVIKSEGATSGSHKFGHETGDASDRFTAAAQANNNIQAWTSAGFQLGTDTEVNDNGVVYNYVVFFEPGESYA